MSRGLGLPVRGPRVDEHALGLSVTTTRPLMRFIRHVVCWAGAQRWIRGVRRVVDVPDEDERVLVVEAGHAVGQQHG